MLRFEKLNNITYIIKYKKITTQYLIKMNKKNEVKSEIVSIRTSSALKASTQIKTVIKPKTTYTIKQVENIKKVDKKILSGKV